MKFVTLTSVLGLSVGLAVAAPFTPKAAENVAVAREALFFGKYLWRYLWHQLIAAIQQT